MNVLFVDDHVACADMFADIAEGLGHRACVAHDGVSALLHYSEETFDLILLDISKIVTDQLRSYLAARAEIPEFEHFKHVFVRASARLNNRAENSHQPTRERERRIHHGDFLRGVRGFRDPERTQVFLSSLGRSGSTLHSSDICFALRFIVSNSANALPPGIVSPNPPKVRLLSEKLSQFCVSASHLFQRDNARRLHRRHDAVFLDENSLSVKRAARCRGCRYDNLLSRGKVGAVGWDECHDGHIGGHGHRIAAAFVRKLQDVAARRLHDGIDIRVRHGAVRPKVERAVSFTGAACGFVEHVYFGGCHLSVHAGRGRGANEGAGFDVRELDLLDCADREIRRERDRDRVAAVAMDDQHVAFQRDNVAADTGDLDRGSLSQRCGACECHGDDGTADCRAVGHGFPLFAFCMSGLNCVTRKVTRSGFQIHTVRAPMAKVDHRRPVRLGSAGCTKQDPVGPVPWAALHAVNAERETSC
jgi:CheY-like chemotaxis protein